MRRHHRRYGVRLLSCIDKNSSNSIFSIDLSVRILLKVMDCSVEIQTNDPTAKYKSKKLAINTERDVRGLKGMMCYMISESN